MQMQTIFLDIMFDPWNILSLVLLRRDLFSMCAQGSFPDAPIYLFPVSLNPQVPGDKDRLAYPALACPRAAGRLHRKSPWPTSCSFAEAADWGCFPGKLSCAFERPLCPSLGVPPPVGPGWSHPGLLPPSCWTQKHGVKTIYVCMKRGSTSFIIREMRIKTTLHQPE